MTDEEKKQLENYCKRCDKIDEKFNTVIYTDVLPAISKAFCYLYMDCNFNNLSAPMKNATIVDDLMKDKACQCKRLIADYIDRQANCVFTDEEST